MKSNYLGAGIALGASLLVAACSDPIQTTQKSDNQPKIEQAIQTSRFLCEVVADNGAYIQNQSTQSKYNGVPQFTAASAPKGKEQYNNRAFPNVLEILYPTRSWALESNDRIDLAKFVSYLPKNASLVVEGYADIRGTQELNADLSKNRADGVAQNLQDRGFRATITHYGNTKATDTKDPNLLALDRKVSVIYGQTAIQRGLQQLDANWYLIDKSGSMEGESWQSVMGFKFSSTAKVFTFSDHRYCTGFLSKERPNGQTPLYLSMVELIENMPAGERLTVLSDGDNNVHGKTPEQVIEIAKSKKIAVSFVEVNVPNSQFITKIATGTGGRVYSIK